MSITLQKGTIAALCAELAYRVLSQQSVCWASRLSADQQIIRLLIVALDACQLSSLIGCPPLHGLHLHASQFARPRASNCLNLSAP